MSDNSGIIRLHGREYKTVALRVQEFREKHPIDQGWGIITKIVHVDGETILFRASITDPQSREIAVGYAEEVRTDRGINATSALEVCETSAIGRALAAAGYGGQEYASADELVSALNHQRNGTGRAPPPLQGFRKSVEDMGVEWGKLYRFAERHEWDPLEDWSRDNLKGLFGKLRAGDFPELYAPKTAG